MHDKNNDTKNDTKVEPNSGASRSAGVVTATDPWLHEHLARPWQLVHTPLEHLRAYHLTDLTLPQLCKVAEVSERTLEYAFRETFELTPRHFLRLRRLHAARRALAAADPRKAAVGHVAHGLGFYELGRFAGEYRRLFDELPSQTLRRLWPESNTDDPPLLR